MIIKCDVCNREFELKNKVKKYNDGIEELYFKCSHCKEKYTSYFTNKNIRIKQKKINNMREESKKVRMQKEYIDILVKIDDMQKEIKIDMKNLRDKMLSTQ